MARKDIAKISLYTLTFSFVCLSTFSRLRFIFFKTRTKNKQHSQWLIIVLIWRNGRCRGKFDLSLSLSLSYTLPCFLVKFPLFPLPLQLEDKLYPLWRLSTSLSLRLPRFTVHSRVTERSLFIAATLLRVHGGTLILSFSSSLFYFTLPTFCPSAPPSKP